MINDPLLQSSAEASIDILLDHPGLSGSKYLVRRAFGLMLNLANSEKRIVLTKRRDMLERQFSGELYFVKGVDVGGQLREVISEFSLTIKIEKMFSICLKCNEKLHPVEKDEVCDRVPPYVFAGCSAYNKCPGCQRIYWEGTHRRNSLQFLKELSIYPQ